MCCWCAKECVEECEEEFGVSPRSESGDDLFPFQKETFCERIDLERTEEAINYQRKI